MHNSVMCTKAFMHISDRSITDIKPRRTRRAHSPEFKLDLVQRSLKIGASVSALALEAGINAKLLFTWRREYLHARASSEMTVAAPAKPPVLLPVEITPEVPPKAAPLAEPAGETPAGTGTIERGTLRLTLQGRVDETMLARVVELLRLTA